MANPTNLGAFLANLNEGQRKLLSALNTSTRTAQINQPPNPENLTKDPITTMEEETIRI